MAVITYSFRRSYVVLKLDDHLGRTTFTITLRDFVSFDDLANGLDDFTLEILGIALISVPPVYWTIRHISAGRAQPVRSGAP